MQTGSPFKGIENGGKPFEPLRPGEQILTQDGERLTFLRYSSTGLWGFFAESTHRLEIEYKLPLAGLRPILAEAA